jgi:hypothetical protein
MTTGANICRPSPKKPPAKRLFSGMVGSPLAQINEQAGLPQTARQSVIPVVESAAVNRVMERVAQAETTNQARIATVLGLAEIKPKSKRGRKPKYANEDERKAADAARKREERTQESQEKQFEELTDRTGVDEKGALPGERSGACGAKKLEQIVAQQDAPAISASGELNDGLGPSGRRRTTVPTNPDVQPDDLRETEQTFQRRASAALSRWAKKQPRKKSCVEEHSQFAEKHKDSEQRMYCGKCRKLLVNPGKPVKGVSMLDGNGNIVVIPTIRGTRLPSGKFGFSGPVPESLKTHFFDTMENLIEFALANGWHKIK